MAGTITKLILFLGLMFMVGCQTATSYYLGAVADADDIVPLENTGAQVQHWSDLYLAFDSTIQSHNQGSRLSGVMRYVDHAQMMYVRSARMTIRVFLLDAENRVVAYQTISGLFPGRTNEDSRFAVTFDDMAGAVAYTFGYEVTFIDDEGMGFRVWNLPQTGS